jgi:acetyl esterase/lipase
MERQELSGGEGVRWIPELASGSGVLVLAGSSGRVDTARAEFLARHGAIAESIRWFGGPGQHEDPWEIAIELFLSRVEDLATVCDRIVVMGTSFGAEAALLTGAHSTQVSSVVAFAPSDVVWTGVTADGRSSSHWTISGVPLPHVPFVDGWEPASHPPEFVDFYRRCRECFAEHVLEAAIPVERIPHVVVVAGGDDRVWSSVTHAEAIAERRQSHGLATAVVMDPEAGHRTILPGEVPASGGITMGRGGTVAADQRLGRKAWRHIAPLL